MVIHFCELVCEVEEFVAVLGLLYSVLVIVAKVNSRELLFVGQSTSFITLSCVQWLRVQKETQLARLCKLVCLW